MWLFGWPFWRFFLQITVIILLMTTKNHTGWSIIVMLFARAWEILLLRSVCGGWSSFKTLRPNDWMTVLFALIVLIILLLNASTISLLQVHRSSTEKRIKIILTNLLFNKLKYCTYLNIYISYFLFYSVMILMK